MLQDGSQVESEEEVRAVLTGTMTQAEGFLLGGVGAFAAGSELEEVAERLGIPGDGGIHPGIVGGVDIDDGARSGVGLTEGAVGAFLWISAPGVGTLVVRGPFDRAGKEDTVALGVGRVPAHGQASFTQGDAVVVDVVGSAGGSGMGAVAGVEGDDGGDVMVGQVFVDSPGIVEGVIDGRVYVPVEVVLVEGFSESVEVVEGEGAVGLGGGPEGDVQGEIMALGGHDVLVEGMSEVVAVVVGVIPPVGGGVGVEPVMVAAIDALLPAGAGGGSVGVGGRRQSGAIPRDDQVGGIAQEALFCRGEDGAQEEEILQALEEIVGTGLVWVGFQAGLEFLGDGVELGASLLRV